MLVGTDLPSSGKAGGKEVEVGAQGGDKEGETGEEAGMENVAVLEDQFEAAEDCLIAAMQCEDVHEDPSKMGGRSRGCSKQNQKSASYRYR